MSIKIFTRLDAVPLSSAWSIYPLFVMKKYKPFLVHISIYIGSMEEVYCVIDLKSFYASCECADRGLDIFTTPLVVADPERTENTIVMSATPYLKQRYGVPNVCRVRELPKIDDLIIAQPRMAYYIEMSAKVVSIFLDYVDEEDLHVYSIDESFLRLTPYLKMNCCTPEQLVGKIQRRIKKELDLTATAGIGYNMFMAKICLDNEGKKRPPYCARWYKEDVAKKLWKIQPITKIWGISHGLEQRLAKLGIRTLEGLAKASPKTLQNELGIIGLQLKELANGIDNAKINEKYIPKETSLSQGQTLIRDYDLNGAKLVLRELVDDLCFRLRYQNSKAGLVSVAFIYSKTSNIVGFSRQCALNIPTDDNLTLYRACLGLVNKYAQEGPIRGLYVSLGKLSPYNDQQQLSLFEAEQDISRRRNLYLAMDEVTAMYGRNAVLRASSLTADSTTIERHTMIGGHKA